MAYPTLTDIEVRWRKSRSGVCVVVEGETELDDAWFYNYWFGDHAREITFFPQNGWEKVVDAVQILQSTIGPKQVYGIVDRDFISMVANDPTPDNGILRTPKYTLENYLLDPECWFRCIQPATLRTPKPGWATVEEARASIEALYQECIPLSAFNWTLRQLRTNAPEQFQRLLDKDRIYVEHPKALTNRGDIQAHFRRIQSATELEDDLSDLYVARLESLKSLSHTMLEEVVSGKYVLHLFLRERFPLNLSGKQAEDDMLSFYRDFRFW